MFSFSDQMLQCPPTERKWKSSVEVAPICPRCASSNTKFCYYNNYSLSQPRYFCKGCRRYWTKGGSLRNVPVGGGCRKSRRGKSSTNRVDKSSMNYSSKSSLSSFRSGEDDSGNKTDGSDIDLAVVFAKFLNQNSTADFDRPDMTVTHESPIEADASNSSNDSSMEYFHKPVFPEPYMLQEIPQVEQQQKEENNSIQELLETNDFELLNLLADEIVQMQDVLWSDDAADTTQSQNLEWQPMVQLQQQFGNSLPLEDQLKISTNYLMNENWSSFDLSGFGINFSNP